MSLTTPLGEQKWPQTPWIVRHGQSAGNLALDKAEAMGQPLIDIAQRNMDIPLSLQGEQQADAVGHWRRQVHRWRWRPSLDRCRGS